MHGETDFLFPLQKEFHVQRQTPRLLQQGLDGQNRWQEISLVVVGAPRHHSPSLVVIDDLWCEGGIGPLVDWIDGLYIYVPVDQNRRSLRCTKPLSKNCGMPGRRQNLYILKSCGFAALGLLPLPEVTALGYAAPLMTVIALRPAESSGSSLGSSATSALASSISAAQAHTLNPLGTCSSNAATWVHQGNSVGTMPDA